MVLRFSFLSARASGCCRGRLEAPSSSKRRQGRFVTEKSKKFFPVTFFSRLPQGVEGPARCREKSVGRRLFFFRSHLFSFRPVLCDMFRSGVRRRERRGPVLTAFFAVRFMGYLPEFGQNKRGKLLSGWKKVCRVGMWHVVAPPSGGARRIRLVLQRSCSCFPYGRAC